MARGSKDPFHRHVSESLANYLSPQIKDTIRSLIADTPDYDGAELLEALESDTVTAWGARSGKSADKELFDQISRDDWFLMRTDSPKAVRYLQQIDVLVGEKAPKELREAISTEIWGRPVYDLLWFSKSPIEQTRFSQSDFVELVNQVDPEFSFTDWFPSQGQNATRINTEVIDHFGGDSAFLNEIRAAGTEILEPGTENYFVLNIADNELDVKTTHRFDFLQKDTEHADEILAAKNDGMALLRDREGLFAIGRIGHIEGTRRDDGRHKIVNILDWQDFDHTTGDDLPDSVEWSTDETVTPISEGEYESIAGEIGSTRPSTDPSATHDCPGSYETAPYYFVKQTNSHEEIEHEYLRAPSDTVPDHDVGRLEEGDTVFNFSNNQIVGYSKVTEPASPVLEDGTEYCRVEVEFTQFDEPLRFGDVFGYLDRDEVRTESYYPLHDTGLNQGYLFNLSQAAGDYLLEQGGAKGTGPDSQPHPLLKQYDLNDGQTVWLFTNSASDWLTVIRRGALQFSTLTDTTIKNRFEEFQTGDIVLFHVPKEEKKINALSDEVTLQHGIIGAGIVGRKRQKNARWWWNEDTSLTYPHIAELEYAFVTSDLAKIDFNRPVFELTSKEIRAEFEALTEGVIQWSTVYDLAEQTTEGSLRYRRQITRLSGDRESIRKFIKEMLDIGPSLTPIVADPDTADLLSTTDQSTLQAFVDLPGLLPAAEINTEDRLNELKRQLTRQNQIILHGPPGTSKTYTATQFARWWLHQTEDRPSDKRVRSVTFHPSFSYEDFMEGLTAEATESGNVEYRYKDGVFKDFYRDALDAYEQTAPGETTPAYVLIIDEINRGNLSQIFGETITQLEPDKRLGEANQVAVSWSHSGEEVTLPPNLYLIGTMNTANQSIALVDAALRRRFSFHAFPPDPDVVIDNYEIFEGASVDALASGSDPTFETLLALSVHAVEVLNENLISNSDLNRGKRIGHTYLLGLDDTPQTVVDTWRFEILPLLEEYYFGDITRLRTELFDEDLDTGADQETPATMLFDETTGEIKPIDRVDLQTALRELLSIDGSTDE